MIYIFPNFPDLEFTDPTITVDPVVSNLDPENMTVDVNVFIERTGDIKGRYGLDINPVKVNDLKSLPIVVTKNTKIYDAAVTMFVENVGTIFIVEEGILQGVISRKDLLKASLGGGNPADIPVGVVMTRMPKIIYCKDDESLIVILRKIVDNEIDCLPVIEDTKKGLKVVGRISKTNIVNCLYDTLK